jgi:adenine deaminase
LKVEIINCALGKVPADLMIKGVNLINVCTGEVLKDIDVAVKNDRIACVGKADDLIANNTFKIDAKGKYLSPGFIESHIHVESSMLSLTEFAKTVIPVGTTGILWDSHEIANVMGIEGLEIIIKEAENTPLKTYFVIPSCVPSAPGLETSGAEISVKEIGIMKKWTNVVGLGEVMAFPAVINAEPQIMEKIREASSLRVIDGHAPGLRGNQLNAYLAAGILSDHETVEGDEGVEKLRLGAWLMIREGSASKNLKSLIKPILEKNLDTRHCLLVSDDLSPQDLTTQGHINHLLKRAVEEGVDPVKAVQMVTINPATYLGKDKEIGSITPGKKADLVLLDSLERFKAELVIIDGKMVAKDGEFLGETGRFEYPKKARSSIHTKNITPDRFNIKAPNGEKTIKVHVIQVFGDTILTKAGVETLNVDDKGNILVDIEKDVLYGAVVERHHGTGNVGLGFIKGFNLKEGAIAGTVAHDSHNIVTVGTTPEEIFQAVKAIKKNNGGLIVGKNGGILEALSLPLFGLLSDKPVQEVAEKTRKLTEAAKKLGTKLPHPFATLSFIALAVIPELRITDKGLVNVIERKIINPIINNLDV